MTQWIDFGIKWLFFPYYLSACFIWRAWFWTNWMIGTYLLYYCLLLTIIEAWLGIACFKTVVNRSVRGI